MRGRAPGRLLSTALLAAGLGLGGLLLALFLRGGSGGRSAEAPRAPPAAVAPVATSPTTSPPEASPAAPPSPAGAAIADLEAASISSFSATLRWRTGSPTTAWVAAGPPDERPLLWWREERPARRHQVTLGGLAFATPYRIWVTSQASEGDRSQATLDLTTAGPPAAPQGAVAEGRVTLDGQPFFPLMSWGGCPETYETSLRAGLNLFAENPCGGLRAQLDALAGRALSAAGPDDEPADGPGLVGSFHPDEADGRGLRGASLPAPPAAGLRFLTLSNHVYSGAAPLPQGRGMYPGLVAASDVVGLDLYPLQEWCRPDRLADVYLAQRELARLARGKPTFQWIEAAGMRCPGGATAVTPETVRAEAWLAVAGGARGLGFFPPGAWTGEVGETIAEVASAVRYLGPALLSPPVPAATEPAGGPVWAGARRFGGALYAVAVNASYAPTRAAVRLPGLAGRPLTVVGEGRTVTPAGEVFRDAFEPLAAHLYVAAPAGS